MYPLSTCSFMASPAMSEFYVIQNPGAGALPVVLASFSLVAAGLSMWLVQNDGEWELALEEGNHWPDVPATDMFVAGRVYVELGQPSGSPIETVMAYFNGAKVNNGNRTLTAAGIGITDIISADPLTVTLVNAPLDALTTHTGEILPVAGIFVDYASIQETRFRAQRNSKIWAINIILADLPQA